MKFEIRKFADGEKGSKLLAKAVDLQTACVIAWEMAHMPGEAENFFINYCPPGSKNLLGMTAAKWDHTSRTQFNIECEKGFARVLAIRKANGRLKAWRKLCGGHSAEFYEAVRTDEILRSAYTEGNIAELERRASEMGIAFKKSEDSAKIVLAESSSLATL